MEGDLEIENVFLNIAGFNCFGCSVRNRSGLHLKFFGAPDGSVYADWTPRADHQSFNGLVHGGLLTLCVDDVAFWSVYRQYRALALTTRLDVQFRQPALVDHVYRIRAMPPQDMGDGKKLMVPVEIVERDVAGAKPNVKAQVHYFIPDNISQLNAIFGADTVQKLHKRVSSLMSKM